MGIFNVFGRMFGRRAARLPEGCMVCADPGGAQVIYSPYYELRHQSDDGKLLAHLIITSGKERVPPGYRHSGPFADDLVEAYANGIVEQVLEVYFSNQSEADVSLRFLRAEFLDKGIECDHVIPLPPRGRGITRGVITLGSNYGTEIPVRVVYDYDGKQYTVAGMAKRLAVDELQTQRFGELRN